MASRTGRPATTEVESPGAWSVGLLGGLRLHDGTQEITRLPSRAVTALLARLALAPERAHAREELIELLWPGVTLEVGRNRLRQALSTLKSILEPAGRVPAQPVLRADRLSVRVVAASLSCDATRFERALRAGRFDEARSLYRGELLPGFYDEWIDDERMRLAALHERLPAEAPPERAVPPVPARDPAAAGPRVLLPSYLTRMFGADEQVARLRGLILTHRLVTVMGPGGSGKTRLAVETACSLRDHARWPLPQAERSDPFEVIAFVPLAACTTLAQAGDALGAALRIAPHGDDPRPALVEALADRRALLVLDNFEQLVGPGRDLVAGLAAELPQLHLVVTSRRALGLDGERELAMSALALPPADAASNIAAANPAVALFVERARAVRADFHFNARNGAVLVELVRELEGMPLAIELAASRVRSMTAAEMLARLRGAGTPRLDLLARTGPRGSLEARHDSMQRTIAWSWDQLDAAQAALLSALTVFPGSFGAEAAVALWPGDAAEARRQLDALIADSLLHAQGGSADALRFALYQPIREFAAARQEEAAARQARRGLVAWALAWARALPLTPSLETIRVEMANLMAAVAAALAEQAGADAIELLLALRRSVETVEWPAEAIAHVQAAIGRCAMPRLQARGRVVLGPMLFAAGRVDDSRREIEAALASGALEGADRARALHALARVRWRSRRRADEVEPLLDEAEAILGPHGDAGLRASVLALRAFVADVHRRDHAGAQALHARALALWEQGGDEHAINNGRYNLAVCAQNSGQHRAALAQLEPVIASARALHDWHRLSQSLNVKGNAHSGVREWSQAVADYRECVVTAWKSMAPYDFALGLWNLPRALAHLRRPDDAIRIAACAAALWSSHFGELDHADRRYLLRVRRLVRRQITGARIEALWREGERLPPAHAVAWVRDLPAEPLAFA